MRKGEHLKTKWQWPCAWKQRKSIETTGEKTIKAESGPRSASACLLKGARMRPAALEAQHRYDF